MKKVLWVIAGVVAGIVVFFAVFMAVEGFSAIVHPYPPDFQGTHEEIVRQVETYPAWVLVVVIPMWMAMIYLTAWTAGKVGGIVSYAIISVLMTVALFCNLTMLPYPVWFPISMGVTGPLALYLGLPKGKTSGVAGAE